MINGKTNVCELMGANSLAISWISKDPQTNHLGCTIALAKLQQKGRYGTSPVDKPMYFDGGFSK